MYRFQLLITFVIIVAKKLKKIIMLIKIVINLFCKFIVIDKFIVFGGRERGNVEFFKFEDANLTIQIN